MGYGTGPGTGSGRRDLADAAQQVGVRETGRALTVGHLPLADRHPGAEAQKPVRAAGATRDSFTFYLATGIIYLALTSVSTVLLQWAENRANAGVGKA